MSVMRVIVLHPRTKFEVRRPSRSEDMADFGHGPGDLLISKWGNGSHVSWASFLPIFRFLCPSFLDLGSGTGQTDCPDRQTTAANA